MARPATWDISISQLNDKIDDYKHGAERGDFRASWEHLLAYLGLSAQEATQIREAAEASKESPYVAHVALLKKTATWVAGQLASASGWGGANTSKADISIANRLGKCNITNL